jgi:hypothetical protein
MRLDIRQQFTVPVRSVRDAYLDPSLYPCFHTVGKLGDIAVLSIDEVDEGRRARVRYRFTGRIPALAATVVDPGKLSFVEETIYAGDLGGFHIIGDHYPRLLDCAGRIELTPLAGGCLRRVTGELRAHLPFVARPATHVVERSIVSGLTDALHAQVPIVEAFVEGGRR